MGGMIKIRSEINRTKNKKTMRKLVKPKVGSLVINNIVELIIRLTSKTNKQQKTKQWEKENTLEISEIKDITPDLRYWKDNKRILSIIHSNILDNWNEIDEFLKSRDYQNTSKYKQRAE